MKKLLFLFAFLTLLLWPQDAWLQQTTVGYFVQANCDTINFRRDNAVICIQSEAQSGRAVGEYRWTGQGWLKSDGAYVGTVAPSTCKVGETFFKTDATPGQNLYACTAEPGTWTLQSGGAGGGTFADISGTISDAQVPDLNTLSTGLTASRCVQTNGSGLLSVAGSSCGTATVDQAGNYTWTGTHSWRDANFSILNSADTSKVLKFSLTGLSAAATRTITIPDASGTMALTSSNVATATALAANPANCAAGQFPSGIDASGAPEGCTALPTTIAGTANQITASASTGAVTLSIPTNPTLPGTTTGVFSGTFAGPLSGNVTSTGQSAFTGSLLVPGKADPGAPVTNELWRSTTAPVGIKYYDGTVIQRSIRDSDFAGSTAGVMNRTGAGAYSILAPTDDTLLVGSGAVWQNKTLPTCADTGGQHLNYDQATNTFSCGTSSGVGLPSVTEDPDSVNIAKAVEVGIQTNNVALSRGASITGSKTYLMNRNIDADVAVTTGTLTTDDNVKIAATGALVRGGTSQKLIQFIIGADNGSALVDGDDQATIFANRYGQGLTINEVWCESDAGTPSINLQRDDGSPANILSSNLSCSTSGASTTTFVSGENAIANGSRIDFVMVAAGGTAKRVTVSIRYTLD